VCDTHTVCGTHRIPSPPSPPESSALEIILQPFPSPKISKASVDLFTSHTYAGFTHLRAREGLGNVMVLKLKWGVKRGGGSKSTFVTTKNVQAIRCTLIEQKSLIYCLQKRPTLRQKALERGVKGKGGGYLIYKRGLHSAKKSLKRG